MKYKEAFSVSLIERFLLENDPSQVLDPFAGVGTVPLTAVRHGMSGTGMEIMPVGVRVGQAIAIAGNGISEFELRQSSERLLRKVRSQRKAPRAYLFPHVKITDHAFPQETEEQIAKARQFLDNLDDPVIRSLLDMACMAVLETASFTRKDGQYLRWDHRSGRTLRSKFDIGRVVPFAIALENLLAQIVHDIPELKKVYSGRNPKFLTGSSLELLRREPTGKYDMIVTSPPYANRYDYSRTYALELAWLGYDQKDFTDLRQSLLTATVENRSKHTWLQRIYTDDMTLLKKAQKMHVQQKALNEILCVLKTKSNELSNKHVIRLLDGYFFELAIVIAELGRIVRPGGTVIMVNDNVQYHGEEVPVDYILADFAEQCGFSCENIWMLSRGKGNSSQQMAKFGRKEIRKCVYQWNRNCD